MSFPYSQYAAQVRTVLSGAQRVLLHLHPSADGDSVGSALAMQEILLFLGVEADIIGGDTGLPQYLAHLPGVERIISKNFLEVDLSRYDVFIILDSSNEGQVSSRGPVTFPSTLTTIVIDHHNPNVGYGTLNIIDTNAPATAQMVYEIAREWQVPVSQSLATTLLVGMYSDTNGFRYPKTSSRTLYLASELYDHAPGFAEVLALIENSLQPDDLRFLGLALSRVELFGAPPALALVALSVSDLRGADLDPLSVQSSLVTAHLRMVPVWQVGVCLLEREPGHVKVSMRTLYGERYDLSLVSARLGGGGHPGAAGIQMHGTLDEVKQKLLAEFCNAYPQWGITEGS